MDEKIIVYKNESYKNNIPYSILNALLFTPLNQDSRNN